MDWSIYEAKFISTAKSRNMPVSKIDGFLEYARNLYDANLPIIYDQHHLCLLIGIDDEYLHRMSNAPQHFYRTFFIKKANGKQRRIDEPLPDLKKVQRWILSNILYNVPCSIYAKAYIPETSLKGNVRFHKNQTSVLAIDIKDYFPSITVGRILNLFIGLGYTFPVSVFLANLCCLNGSLPQGAPTSAYLSNLIMRNFDAIVGEYAKANSIRYTRYADDLTFSGDLNISDILLLVDRELSYLGLKRNPKKFKVMRQKERQIVTGIVVNNKPQMPREYRMKIRQEVYYIQKHGLSSHLKHTNETKSNYLNHLLGQIHYCLFINPKDSKMQEYLRIIESLNTAQLHSINDSQKPSSE